MSSKSQEPTTPPPVYTKEYHIPHTPKEIPCLLSSPFTPSSTTSPSLIFTHGAGGTLQSDAIANFAHGFATSLPILCFQGNINLKSRAKMFDAVIEAQSFSKALGGRSMGARAAVMSVKDETTHLVLVSYPLQSGKDVRDQILLDIPEHVKVIFVSGDKDSMCDLERLEAVRKKMKCQTWKVVVQDADHGMNVRPKSGTENVVRKTGEVVAGWLEADEEEKREGRIWWDGRRVLWSEWGTEVPAIGEVKGEVQEPEDRKKEVVARPGGKLKTQAAAVEHDHLAGEEEAVSSRTRKRRKI